MAYSHKVCSYCFEQNGKDVEKIRALLTLKCLDRASHRCVRVRVRVTKEGTLDPEIRPVPADVNFTGEFELCTPAECKGEECKLPHCLKEKVAWNAQKFGVTSKGSATSKEEGNWPAFGSSGEEVTSAQQRLTASSAKTPPHDTEPSHPQSSISWNPADVPVPQQATYANAVKQKPHEINHPTQPMSPNIYLLQPQLRPVSSIRPPQSRQQYQYKWSSMPNAPQPHFRRLPLAGALSSPSSPLYGKAPLQQPPIVQQKPLKPRETPRQIASVQEHFNHRPPSVQKSVATQHQCGLPILGGPHHKSSLPAFQRTQSSKYCSHSVYDQPLTIDNYCVKFEKLLSFEKTEHSELLKQRCSGKYMVCIYKAGQIPKEVRSYGKHVRYGYFGMGCDEVSYATQAANTAVVKLSRNCNIECEILRDNMHHAEEQLYIGFTSDIGDNILSHFKQVERYLFKSLKPIHINFQLKHSYFGPLKKSIENLNKRRDVIARILPTSSSFTAIPNQKNDKLDPYQESCSPDQYEALKVIASAPTNGPPILVSGLFGTGKTCVLAFAAHYFLQESVRQGHELAILVCTQQHTAAEAYLEMYLHHTKHAEDIVIIRLVPEYYYVHRNRYEKNVELFKKEMVRNVYQTNKHYLIITTCLTAKQISDVVSPGFITHIFLDEGAQMREPEAVAPLCMAGPNTKIVIAGDKFQVGPAMLVLGKKSQEYGLAASLLERLYESYQKLGEVAQSYCVHLSTNFRCHQGILDLAHQVAYQLPLKCGIPNHIAHPQAQFPLRFVCTSLDMNVRETIDSICRIEVDTALKEASRFFIPWPVSHWGDKDLKKICFLSPCKAQVTVARKFKEKHLPPQVEYIRKITTYTIQGEEFRALFISTSEPTNAEGESRDSTKSISDPAVFITAITRARSLVVAVGNPFMLLRREEHMVKRFGDRGHCWSLFLKACFDNNTISSIASDDSSVVLERLKEMIVKRVSHLKMHEPKGKKPKPGVPSIAILPNTLTHKMAPESPRSEQLSEQDSLTESHKFKDHLYMEMLGRGGFGVVCCMQHKVDQKKYAVKIVRLRDKPDEEKKVMREVRVLAQLEHPNIVRYYDSWKECAPLNWRDISPWKNLPDSDSVSYPSGTRLTGESASQMAAPEASTKSSPHSTKSELSNVVFEASSAHVQPKAGTTKKDSKRLIPERKIKIDLEPPMCLCIKTELCDRDTLKTWLSTNKTNRTRRQVTGWFTEILKGVKYIHSNDLIHRDLKPSNIFFSKDEQKIKIGDFGLVTTSQVAVGEGTTSQKSNYVGTSYYISPEQVKKEHYGKEVDIYALGITFFEMNCPFMTDMERHEVLTVLRSEGKFPKNFESRLVHEATVIRWMLTEAPTDRPSAEHISSSPTLKRLVKSSNRSKITIPRF